MPAAGSTVWVSGPIVDREHSDQGLFVIDLTRITYLPSASRFSASKSPTKGGQSGNDGSSGGGHNWMKSQQSAKKKRKRNEKDDDEDQGEGPSNLKASPS